jgi:endonuclease/exonuclease/phosphatase family metal-dependent hydrolase
MTFHFNPAMNLAEERYGDAILTALPMRLVKCGGLPVAAGFRALEPRGAVWTAVDVGGVELQVINTHLGLVPLEQRGQMACLLGRDWVGHGDCARPAVLLGDFNIAPLECDVWNHKALLDVVSHTPIEVETLGKLQAAHDWVDLGRKFIPAPERCYTWWSYRAQDWAASDRGRRLDHMWCSPDLASQATSHRVLEPCRSWERPSDHVPLILELKV